MSTNTHVARGDLVLNLLRFCVLATASTLVGVLGHVVWKLISA